MTTLNLVIGIIFLIAAVCFIVLGAIATAGKLPGNKTIGLRVPEVRKNESTWVQAHKVVGPFWILTGVALGLGAAFAFIAQGWGWIAPAIAAVAAVVSLSVGGNFGARAAALVDATIQAQSQEETAAEETAAAPAVDLESLRRAAGHADER